MSAKAVGHVYEIKLTPAKQQVLLAYADHADHEGRNIDAGIPLIAWKTGYSERQTRRITRELEIDGLLMPTAVRSGKPTLYDIDFSKGERKPAFQPRTSHGKNELPTPDKMSAHDPANPGQDVRVPSSQPRTSHGKNELPTPDMPSAKTVSYLNKEKELLDSDPILLEVLAEYESKINRPSDEDRAVIAAAIAEFGGDNVLEAIRTARARKSGGEFIHHRYIVTILKNQQQQRSKAPVSADSPSANPPTDGSRYVSGNLSYAIDH